MNQSKAASLVEEGLSPDERRQILETVARINPHLTGADVGDVLDMLYSHDSYVGELEDLFNRHMPKTMSEDEARIMWMCLLATRLLTGTADWKRAAALCRSIWSDGWGRSHAS